jgi:hypothetical protein
LTALRTVAVVLAVALLSGCMAGPAAPSQSGEPSMAARVQVPTFRASPAGAEGPRDPGTFAGVAEEATPMAAPVPKRATRTGTASTYGPGWEGWIAWPGGPGWKLRVCGPGGCATVVTTDSGPDLAMQRAGRIVDLDVATFERVAGGPWTIGLTKVTVTVLSRPALARDADPGS